MSSQAYTPGLKRKEYTKIMKERTLPVLGDVLVNKGDRVLPDTVIAVTNVPGEKHLIKVSEKLDIYPEKIMEHMIKRVGDTCKEDEIIAIKKGFFGLSRTELKSNVTGTIERISDITGEVIISGIPLTVQVNAYIHGKVEEVIPEQGAIISTNGVFLQGIFGIGGETTGELMVISKEGDEIIEVEDIPEECQGKIIVGGAMITGNALIKTRENGAKGIIVGGIMDEDLYSLLGYEMGVAITGNEEVGITLIIMEGFGKMNISKNAFEILKKNDGKQTSINGSTQIRAGVIRPEIIIPKEYNDSDEILVEPKDQVMLGLVRGTKVRIIREPYFGELGIVETLPKELFKIETESDVRILMVKIEDGRKVIVPRANVEIIEE